MNSIDEMNNIIGEMNSNLDEANNCIMALSKENDKLRTAIDYNRKANKYMMSIWMVAALALMADKYISNDTATICISTFWLGYVLTALMLAKREWRKAEQKLAAIDKEYEILRDEYKKQTAEAANDNENEDDGVVVITVKMVPYQEEKKAPDITPIVKGAAENMPVNIAGMDVHVAILKHNKSKQYMAKAHQMKSQQIARTKLMNKHYLASKKKQQMFIARQGRRK